MMRRTFGVACFAAGILMELCSAGKGKPDGPILAALGFVMILGGLAMMTRWGRL